VFGNPHLSYDALAVHVARHLPSTWDVRICSTPDALFDAPSDKPITILDVVKNITTPQLIDDITVLKDHPATSTHDIDVGFVLKLRTSLGIPTKIQILGIPPTGNPQQLAQTVVTWWNTQHT